MKNRNRKRPRRPVQTIQLWTREQARAAVPYFGSVLRSLREERLAWLQQRRTIRNLARRPGRPDREALIAQQEAQQAADRAAERFEEGIQELKALDVYCLDPVRGEAVIPCVVGDQLAWLIYDLFAPEPLQSWRYATDQLGVRRPLDEQEKAGEASKQ